MEVEVSLAEERVSCWVWLDIEEEVSLEVVIQEPESSLDDRCRGIYSLFDFGITSAEFWLGKER